MTLIKMFQRYLIPFLLALALVGPLYVILLNKGKNYSYAIKYYEKENQKLSSKLAFIDDVIELRNEFIDTDAFLDYESKQRISFLSFVDKIIASAPEYLHFSSLKIAIDEAQVTVSNTEQKTVQDYCNTLKKIDLWCVLSPQTNETAEINSYSFIIERN